MHNDQMSVSHTAIFQRVSDAVASVGQHIASWAHAFSTAVKHMQHARMAGVLHGMTDAQLAQIDVKRADIFSEAAKMVNLDQNA